VIRFREQQDGSEGSYVKTSSDAQLHVWIRARHDATNRLARYSKMAIDAGVSERQIAYAERLGGRIGELLKGVLGELYLTDEQRLAAPRSSAGTSS
jgi:hypothetical protein